LKESSDLEKLRGEIKAITIEIIHLARKRLLLAKKIGEIKHKRGLSIENLNVEEELKKTILKKCNENNLNSEFCLKLIDLLTEEAKRLQTELK
jgi:aspartate aminotransferase